MGCPSTGYYEGETVQPSAHGRAGFRVFDLRKTSLRLQARVKKYDFSFDNDNNEWLFSHTIRDIYLRRQRGLKEFMEFKEGYGKFVSETLSPPQTSSHRRVNGGFVFGCAGETVSSVEKSIRFAEEAAAAGVLERINAAIMVIMPGAPAYNLLCRKEPWIRGLDLLDTEKIRWHWLHHFCPDLEATPTQSRRFLQDSADRLDDLCADAHASMGFVSNRMLKGSSRRAA